MTEQPNTAAIRAMLWNGLDVETALELCDSLDAARAERDEYLAHCHKVNGRLEEWIDIAEAAEATLTRAENAWRGEVQRFKDDAAEQQRRAEAAEARADELVRLQDRCEWAPADLHGLNFNLGWGTSGLSLLADRLEAAEARIAAALALIRNPHRLLYSEVVVACIESALTEGTDQ